MTDRLRVQRQPCQSCIYLRRHADMLPRIEAAIADPHMEGYFTGHRICHHSTNAVCAGFWAQHKDAFTLGQLAQRLNRIEFVQENTLTPQRRTRHKAQRSGSPDLSGD